MRPPHRWRAALPCVLAVLALASPSSATAHAELQGNTPANETTFQDPPSEVTLTFTEDVQVAFGGVKAYAPDGSRADDGTTRVDGDTVTAPIDAEAEGTYAVSWRAISADGHPVRGAFVFHLGEASGNDVSREEALSASEDSRPLAIAFGVARGAYLLAVLAAVGAAVFAAFVAPTVRPRLVRASLLGAFVALLVAFVLDASVASGLSIVGTLDPDVLGEQSSTVFGRATLIRLVLVVACLVAWTVGRRRWDSLAWRSTVVAAFLALAASLSLSGHAVGEGVSALRLPLDMVHSMSAAIWLGGILQLVVLARSGGPVDVGVVRRFSAFAMTAVIALVATGLYATWQEVGITLDGLVQTTYGRLVIAKSGLLLATLPLANANRTRTIRALATDGEQQVGTARLRRLATGELALLVLVVAATAWLVQTVPAKVELRPDFVERTEQLGSGGSLQLIIDPAALGTNEVHVYAFNEQRQPDGDITQLTLTTRQEARQLGPLDIELESAGPGHWTTSSATFPFAGRWSFTVSVRRGEFDEELVRFSAQIANQPDQE